MKYLLALALAALAGARTTDLAVPYPSQNRHSLLLFSKTAGYRHESISNAIELVSSIARKNGWQVTATEDSSIFTAKTLSKFSSLVFLHTTGDLLLQEEYNAMYQYLLRGGSWLGIHAAGDFGNNTPPWYQTLVGGQFEFHPCAPAWTCNDAQRERYPPSGNIRTDIVTVQDRYHPSTFKLPATQNRTDEWYSYRTNPRLDSRYTILATIDETYIDDVTPEYLSMKPDHPISWYSIFRGKARSWYTGMGHTAESYTEPYFVEHVTGGLKWVLGER